MKVVISIWKQCCMFKYKKDNDKVHKSQYILFFLTSIRTFNIGQMIGEKIEDIKAIKDEIGGQSFQLSSL